MRALSLLVVLSALLVALPAGAQQDPDFIILFEDGVSGPVDGQAQISNLMDLTTAPVGVAGWSWGVCQDGVAIVAIEDGQTTIDLDPAFNAPALLADGWTVGVVIDFFGMIFLMPGDVSELHIGTYDVINEGDNPVSYCDTLGNPVVETVLVDSDQASRVPTQIPNMIVGTTTPAYLLHASDEIAGPGATATVTVSLDTDLMTAPPQAEGFAFGITHDASLVTLSAIEQGSTVAAANGGSGPDFFGVQINPDGGVGGTVGCAISLDPPFETIPLGDQEIVILTYQAGVIPNMTSDLDFTDGLGDPTVTTLLSVGGFPVIPTLQSGSITIQDGPIPDLFVRGDGNNDGIVDVSDATYVAKALFSVGDPLTCDDAGDIDDNGVLEPLIDTIALLEFLFQDGPTLAAPYPACGADPTDDLLECDDAPGCP